MSTLKISQHSDVPSALDLVKEEVGKEAKRINKAGGAALTAGQIEPANEAIAYAKRLRKFVEKIEKLGDEWSKLEAGIDAAAPEVKEIVLTSATPKPHKVGFTRKVGKLAPKTNFTVSFPDGTVVSDKKAYWVLARSIEKMGADKVAALGVMVGGEPLVTQNKALLQKRPSSIAEISGGWYVKTHSSTAAKIDYVKRVAKALKIKVTIKAV